MKRIIAFAVIAMVGLFFATAALAQDWTKDQSELWKLVENTWINWKSGDIDGMEASIHERYQGWSNESPLPVGREKMLNWYREMKDVMKVNFVEVEPARITITNNSAVVDYYFSANLTYTIGEDKKTEEIGGKNVEFWIKEGGKWQLLGDMTVFKEQDDED